LGLVWGSLICHSRKWFPEAEGRMVKVSVFYPNKKGNRFDMAYYCDRHIPLVQRLPGPALKGTAVEQGLGGSAPGSPATYVAMGHLLFDSADAFQRAFGA